jgi:tripartite-type tricarboxylate transporter receptor subunit TctC
MKILSLFMTALLSLALQSSYAAPYPTQPVKIIIGFAPGSSIDTFTRVIAQKLAERLKQSVIVENRPGAGGNIGAETVAKAAPDGYTLLACNTGLAIAPAIYNKLNYSPAKDLIGVTLMASMPHVLIAPISLPANTIAELLALAKTQPGKLNFGSAGVGNADHLAGELLRSIGKIDIVHIPYKGGAQAMTDTISGNVSLFFSGLPGALPMIEAGKVKPLGVSTTQRHWSLPNVPAIAEGLPGFDETLWYALMAPAGTPQEIIQILWGEVAAVLKQPDTLVSMKKMGADPSALTSKQFQAFFVEETNKWGKIIQDAGIRAD